MEKIDLQTKVFEWMQSTADKVGEFATREIPPFITEYLHWKFFEASIPIVFYAIYAIILTILTFRYLIPLWKWAIEKVRTCSMHNNNEFAVVIPIVITIPLILITLLCFPYSEIKDCVQIKIAPKVYLIEKASEIIKSN
jgi:hypothetical protein